MGLDTLDKLFAIDSSKSKNGIPIEFGLNEKDQPVIMIVSDLNHPDAQKIHRKYEKAFENSRHIPKKRALVWARYLAEAVLKDWSGIIDADGNPIAATMENKIDALVKYEWLFSEILRAADSRENFRPAVNDEFTPEEDSEKNLGTT